ncbi:MAG: hypothetical protein P3C09_11265, partial [Gemmatimonadota bacterium]|nr:hypothetical protein [Gemmatimonadota bacterium]
NTDGTPSVLTPYMGMAGHAMVLRRDAGVFMHLHPMGTASMTAQAQLIRRERGDSVRRDSVQMLAEIASMPAVEVMSDAAHRMHMGEAGALSFPFAFQGAGAFRVFVQVRRGDVVETAAFDVTVPAVAAP